MSSPGTRVWLRQPEHELDDPGDPVETPGLEVGVLFRRVMGNVKQATGGKQHPELSILLDSEFYFKPGS